MSFSPSLSLPHCCSCGWWCIMKSAASTAWLTHKDIFSVPDAKLFTDSYSAPNTSVLPAKKNKSRPHQAAAHFSFFSCRSGDCEMLVWLHTVPDDILTLGDWLQISKEPQRREVLVVTHSQILWVLTCPRRSQLKVPTCHSLSFQQTSQMHLILKHITKQWCSKTKGTSPLSLSRITPSPGERTSKSPCGKLDSCTLNYSPHLQTKLKPTLLVCIFPNAVVQRETRIVRSMGY